MFRPAYNATVLLWDPPGHRAQEVADGSCVHGGLPIDLTVAEIKEIRRHCKGSLVLVSHTSPPPKLAEIVDVTLRPNNLGEHE